MNVLWRPHAWDVYLGWQREDRGIFDRINALIADVRRSPFKGIGHPEPLRNELAGWWSRRISKEHRLVYRIVGKGADQRLEILQCRFHYST